MSPIDRILRLHYFVRKEGSEYIAKHPVDGTEARAGTLDALAALVESLELA